MKTEDSRFTLFLSASILVHEDIVLHETFKTYNSASLPDLTNTILAECNQILRRVEDIIAVYTVLNGGI